MDLTIIILDLMLDLILMVIKLSHIMCAKMIL